jgi:hypothetical protein
MDVWKALVMRECRMNGKDRKVARGRRINFRYCRETHHVPHILVAASRVRPGFSINSDLDM